MWHNQIYQTFGCWVQKQSVHVVVGGLFLFFDTAMLFLDPLPDDFGPGELFRFTALVQLCQCLFVQTDAEYKVFGIFRKRTASAYGQSIHHLSWSYNNYILILQKSQEVFRKKFRRCLRAAAVLLLFYGATAWMFSSVIACQGTSSSAAPAV